MKTRLILTLALLLLGATPAAAQPSAAHRAAAVEVLEASGSRETYLRAMELGLQEGGMGEMSPKLQATVREVLNDLFRWEDMQERFVALYTELFTEAELRDVAAVYRTPGGRVLVERAPELAVGSQAIVQERLAEVMPEMMSRIMAAVQAEEADG
jgi:hypothetical protein